MISAGVNTRGVSVPFHEMRKFGLTTTVNGFANALRDELHGAASTRIGQMFKFIGNLDALGSPLRVFSGVGRGVKEAVQASAAGVAMKNPLDVLVSTL